MSTDRGRSRCISRGVVVEQLPEPGQGLPRHNNGGALPVRLLLRDLEVQAPGIRFGVAKEYFALYLCSTQATPGLSAALLLDNRLISSVLLP